MKIIKLHFYRGTRIFSKIVQWRTYSEFSHVSIEIDGYIYESKEGYGVRRIQALKTPPRSLVKSVEYSLHPDDVLKARIWLEKQLGRPYDYRGLLLFFGVPKRQINDKKWYCSELAYAVCRILLICKEHDFPVSPGTLYLLLK